MEELDDYLSILEEYVNHHGTLDTRVQYVNYPTARSRTAEKNSLVIQRAWTKVTNILAGAIIAMQAHRPGVAFNMTVKEYKKRELLKEGQCYVILVKEHKTSAQGSATVVIGQKYTELYDRYFKLRNLIKHDQTEKGHFFLLSTGRKLCKVTSTLKAVFKDDPDMDTNAISLRVLYSSAAQSVGGKTLSDVIQILNHSPQTSKNIYQCYTHRSPFSQYQTLRSLGIENEDKKEAVTEDSSSP